MKPATTTVPQRADSTCGRLVDILCRLLPESGRLTADTVLSDAGLSSLAAVRLVLEADAEFGVEVPLPRLLQCRTVGDLAAWIDEAGGRPGTGEAAAPPGVPTEPERRHEPFPATPLQEAYVVGKYAELDSDAIGCHHYHEFELDGLDVERLSSAWQRVVAHFDALRLTGVGRSQRVLETARAPEPVVHETEGPDDWAATAADVRSRMSHHRYPPGEWPPFTIEITRRSPSGRAVVHFGIDGGVTDAHGTELLLRHWWGAYESDEHELPLAPFSLRDSVVFLARRRESTGHRADLEYWTERLKDLPGGPDLLLSEPPEPPADLDCHLRRPRRARLVPAQWRALRRRATELGVSPTTLVLSVFTDVLGGGAPAGPFSLVLTTTDRSRMPREAERLIGPYTSSCVLVVDDEPGARTSREAVGALHQQVWEALSHSSVSGVEVLRELRARGTEVPRLPVVFTSLLDIAVEGADAGSMADHERYAVGQTSGVALDHQVRLRAGGLEVRWDTADALFPTGTVDALFSRYCQALQGLCEPAEPVSTAVAAPLNGLQQAYYVPRVAGDRSRGCQLHQSFTVTGFNPGRLQAAWLRLVREHDVLRTRVGDDGRQRVLPDAPADQWIPVVDLADAGDAEAEAVEHALRHDMTHRPFPLGRGPHADLRVVRRAAGRATVHLAVDLLVADARSIVLLARELLWRYADPSADIPAHVPTSVAALAPDTAPAAAAPSSGAEPAEASGREHWRARLVDLPSGPRLPEGTPGAHDPVRRTGRLTERAALLRWAGRHGVELDTVLLAAYCAALAAEWDEPFTVPVVRWQEGDDSRRPAELTALSWVRSAAPGTPPPDAARAYGRILAEDAATDASAGLAEMRRLVLRRRRDEPFAHPVVFTSVLDVSDHPLPSGTVMAPWGTATPDVALDCVTVDDGEALHVAWDAVADRFPDGLLDAAFARFLDTLRELTEQADDESRDRPADRPEPGGERHRMVYEWNDTAVPYRAEGPVHLRFEEQAALRPDAVALRWRGGTMSYGELNRRANLVAGALRRRGVTAGTPIAISVRRGPAMAVSVLGVLKAGGVYVPVDPSLPAERAAGMLEDTAVRTVLTTPAAPAWAVPPGIGVLDVESDDLSGADVPDPGNAEPVTGPDSTAYLIFTSGSTGRPKCVSVAHRSLHNLFGWCERTFGFGPEDTGLCVTSLGFDLSVFDILGLLGTGAGLYIADETEQLDPELLTEVLLREPITFWNSAPTTLAQLAPLFGRYREHPGRHDLRLVFLSGDYTPLSLPGVLREVFDQADLVSLGGATEATVWSNWFPVGEIDPEWRSIPYGRPIDNARYYILDERMEPCPVGTEGDLYIAGDCLSLGYPGQPGVTAERFVPDPFHGGPDERMYRTGDRAAFRPDGVMTFLGRLDHQVKIRGFRVELSEIEHRVRAHPAVRDAVVLARQDGTGDRRVVAYLLAEPGQPEPSVGDLRRFAARTLPDYMVPNFAAFLPSFPATANGKLDREALPWPLPGPQEPAPEPVPVPEPGPVAEPALRRGTGTATGTGTGAVAVAGKDVLPSAGALQDELVSLLAGLIDVPEVDPTLDLWDQGATSFTLAQLSSTLRERYGRRVPVSALLAEPTVASMVRHLTGQGAGGTGTAAAAFAVPDAPTAPVVPAVVPGPTDERPADEPGVVPGPADEPGDDPGDSVEFFSPQARAEFKSAARHLRPQSDQEPVLRLTGEQLPPERFEERATRRDFDEGPLAYADFCRFLTVLRQRPEGHKPSRLYASAGDTYAVQVYLHVKPHGVAGVPEGVYYYRPGENALQRVGDGGGIDRTTHFQYNRAVYDRAAFEVYLISEPRGIAPLYGPESELYLALEAGYIGQLLMSEQQDSAVGLCPVGALAFASVRDQFRLHPGQRLLHSFMAGPVTRRAASAPTAAPAPVRAAAPEPVTAEVAVTGMAGIYPGARDLDSLWEGLSLGRSALGALPAARAAAFRAVTGSDGPSSGSFPHGFPHGGYLTGTEPFDSLLFRISPREAELLDPQLRLLLPVVWQCLEDAGHTPASLHRSAPRVGVFTAVMWHDHRQSGEDRRRAGAPAELSGAASDIPARIAHCFGFEGPAVAVDTACSSSLTALHLAVQSLRRGDCDAAVVTGVNVVAHPYHLALLTDLGLAATLPGPGAFAEENTGWSPGEGAGALLLRPLRAAAADRDVLHGVIEATGVGSAGGAGRFGTPAVDALARSLEHMLRQHGIAGRDIGYAECAASGATLADAAEVEALLRALRPAERADQPASAGGPLPLTVGTVKPNIGHLEAASGLSQLTKALLQMRHRALVPTALADRRTPLVDWEDARLDIVDGASRPWEPLAPGAPLRALVNAMSASGSYGHAVLRSASPDDHRRSDRHDR
ncbi:non-ribosomal peptide synthetase [Streptomyces sp. RKAG293]|uniref:non-ribosomal peptide synthetase n=1 Tax=Streptomyces sp. RKAG293 TaxID=2893403 RepID=UPI002034A701|nr:non-ribosomal peptide synthetase [Streptomyces sp. RKAG293]MCM2416781.1 amino acid adenylation domain-containing protein [Streptomyces sp. RKAG293]